MWGGEGDGQAVMWAVTDMEAVPAGAMLINPQVNANHCYINLHLICKQINIKLSVVRSV